MADEPTPLTRRELREQREREEQQRAERAPESRRHADPARARRKPLALGWMLHGWGIGILWLGTHLLVGAAFLLRFGANPDRWNALVVGEVYTQFAGVSQLGRLPIERVLAEVPAPAVRLMQGLYAVTGEDRGRFFLAIVALAVVADLVILIALWRASAGGPVAAAYWALAVPLLGPVTYARLDLVVVAVVVLAWLLAPRRPLWAGALLAVATGLGLWPAAVFLPLLALVPRGSRRLAVAGYAVISLAFIAVGFLGGGWDRLASPITRALTRGLSLESIPGLPTLVDMALSPGRHTASLVNGDMVVRGPWVEALVTGSTALVVVPVVVVIALGVLVLRRREALASGDARVGRAKRRAATQPTPATALVALAGLLTLLVTARTLSPEALVWTVPFLAVLAARRPGRGPWLALVVLLVTQIDYPYLFQGLTYPAAAAFDVAAAAILVRNVALLALLVWSLLAAVRELRSSAGVAPGQ